MKPLLIFLFALSSIVYVSAQKTNTDSSFYKTFNKGIGCYSRNSFDSAIAFFKSAASMAEQQQLTTEELYSSTLNNIGICYQELAKPQLAHEYMYKSWLHAKKYKHLIQENNALLALNNLHWTIVKNNWQFTYPPVQTTTSGYSFFPVEKTMPYQNADSIIVIIYGGSNDGITDSSFNASIYKRYDSVYKNHPNVKNVTAIGRGIIKSIEPNRTTLVVKRSSDLPIEKFDQANIYCQTPIDLKKSHFIDLLKNGINLSDYTKTDRLVSRRFLFHYNDEKVNFGFIKILKQQLLEVQNAYAEDTLKANNLLAQKATSGIFYGLNIIKAMDSSNTRQLVRFLHFVAEYPGKYFGNNFSFAEVYASWLINNTPLKPDDLLDYLFVVDDDKRPALTGALMDQIEKNNLVDKWVSNGLSYLDQDDLLHVRGITIALENVFKNNKDTATIGWAYFFRGMYQYKAGDIVTADTMLKKSLRLFTKVSNKEGMGLCKQAINKIHTNSSISLQVQSGNFFSYKVAIHPSGKYYATAARDKSIRIWNLQLGKETKLLQEHTDEVTSIAYSPNGRYLASCSRDKTIKLWSTFDYSLVATINTNRVEYCLAFSTNNKQLASGGQDSLIKMWDIATGNLLYSLKKHNGAVRQLCFVAKDESKLYSSGLDSMVYEWDLETKKDMHWYRKKATLLNMKVSSNGHYLFYTANDTTVNVWNIAKGKFYFSQKISFAKSGTTNNFGEPDFSPDGNLLVYPDNKNRLAVVDLASGNMNTVSIEASPYQYLNTINFTPDQKSIFVTYPMASRTKLFDFSNFRSVENLRQDVTNIKSFKAYSNPIGGIQFSNDGSSLYAISDRLSRFNLTNGTTKHLMYSPQHFYNDEFMVNDSIAMQTEWPTISILYNQFTREAVSKISLGNNDTIASCRLYASRNLAFIAGKKGLVEQHKFINQRFDSVASFSIQLPLQYNEEATTFRLDTCRNRLLVSSTENKMYCMDMTNGKIMGMYSLKPFSDFAITPTHVYFNNHDGTVTQTTPSNFKTKQEIKVGNEVDVASFIKTSNNFKYLVAFVNEADFVVIDATTNKIKYQRKAHEATGYSMAISADNRYLATGGFDSKICLFNLETGEKMLNIFTPADLDFVAADTNGNYLANKKSLEGLSFKYNDKIYEFDQFDLKFNRPDLVLQQTGRGDTALIDAYKKAVQKRIRKAGYADEGDVRTTELPSIILKDQTELQMFTTLGHVETFVECSDSKFPLKALHLIVNGNPVYGLAGKGLGSNSKDTILSIKIPLAFGKNNIKLYCTNSLGQTSLQQNLDITSSYEKNKKRKTWFVGIGVSDYKDKSMNLRYAAKDIRDLVGTFTKGKDTAYVSVDTLLNENATLKNILALKQKLMKADINDKIIMAVTGHGLLNKALDFYYATYDIDFDNPEQKGLKYEQLESLLDGVPAQHKLLLIDACHSGALDKEAMLADTAKTFVKTTEKDSGSISTNARSTIKVKQSKVSLNNTFELMQSMFADFGNSNGTIVISAAGGLEYAFESAQWNNGVFTYCVRKGIEESEADDDVDSGNFDGDVTVQELMKYVSKKVPQLTNGRQRPTNRRESLEYDWVLKYYTK